MDAARTGASPTRGTGRAREAAAAPVAWRAEDILGASFVIAAFAFIAVTLWLGWPAVSGWIASA